MIELNPHATELIFHTQVPANKMVHSNTGYAPYISLGPVVSISAIFSNANILKFKIIERYHIKCTGCPLLISIDIDSFNQETEK